jgi:hypothetical protein
MEALTRLDAKVVPRLARGMNRVARVIRGIRVRPLTVVATVLVVAVVGTALWRLARPEPGSPGSSPTWIGVHESDSIPAYVESTRVRLAELVTQAPDRPVLALVSFGAYLTPDQVTAVVARVPEVAPLTGYARVPIPGRQTERVSLAAERVPGDLVAAMAALATRKESDARTSESLASEQPPGPQRTVYASNAEVARAEAAAYRGACACLFALLVRATPAALTSLAQTAEVRAVDPAPDIANPDDGTFVAPLPEQVDRVQPIADEALPTSS